MGLLVGIVKLMLFLFNFILLIVGISLIYIGLSVQVIPKELDQFGEFAKEVAPAYKIIIVVGVIIFVLSFFGCCGTFVESTFFLSLYAIFLVVLIVLEAFVAFYILNNKDFTKKNAEEIFHNALNKYDAGKEYKKLFDVVQQVWECCGAQGPTDWTQKTPPLVVPPSCCQPPVKECSVDKSFQKGCLPEFINIVDNFRNKIFWITMTAVAFKVVIVLLTVMVRYSILQDEGIVY